MNILGISAYYHDSAAVFLRDGKIIAAVQEERFTRVKHDSEFPVNSISYCLEEARCTFDDIDFIAFYDKPFLKFERLLQTYMTFAPKGFASFRMAMPIWLREKLFQKDLIIKELKKFSASKDISEKLLFSEHHLSHAASAFYPSPFDEALVLTMDGVGEWATTSASIGRNNSLKIFKEIHFPHSLGLLYSAFTYYTGFKVNSGEYKLMGLAPYGKAEYFDLIKDNLIDIKDDGSFRLNQEYFDYCTGLTMTNEKFNKLFGRQPRKEDEELEQFHMDVASSIQKVTEEVIVQIAKSLASETKIRNLCLAGGVALNCVANGKLVREKIFDNVWIQPAAGDAGGALGAAFTVYYGFLKNERNSCHELDQMSGSYLGPEYAQSEIEERLNDAGALFEVMPDQDLFDTVSSDLVDELVIGWHQGRMEFGPRALGARSIIGDPRSSKMQKTMNLKIKYRESFRPFAPSVLADYVSEWFEHEGASPYMLVVADVREQHRKRMTLEEEQLFGIEKLNIVRSDIPAITHVDYSARVQTVHKETNPKYYSLIAKFREKTGCPILVNTSFNVRGEPIVNTPEDAFKCFMGTEMDRLVVGNCYLRKEQQDPALARDYKNAFDLD